MDRILSELAKYAKIVGGFQTNFFYNECTNVGEAAIFQAKMIYHDNCLCFKTNR